MRSIAIEFRGMVIGGCLIAGTTHGLSPTPPAGPVYPPPNGVTFGSVGDSGRAGGRTWSFTGVNLTGLSVLYWGPSKPVLEALDGAVDAPSETLAFSGYSPTQAVWGGASTAYFAPGFGGAMLVDTRFTLTLSGAATFLSVGSALISNGNAVAAKVSGDFNANLLFEVRPHGGGSFMPVLDFVSANGHAIAPTEPNGVLSSFQSGFWYKTVSLTGAVSRKLHGGTTSFDIDLLPLGPAGSAGVECRNGGPTTVIVTFSEPVAAGGTSSPGVMSAGPDPNQKTITLSGVADKSCLAITMTGVTDLIGNPLVGNKVYARVLLGDTNGDGQVGSADVSQTKIRNGASLAAGTLDSTNFRSDTNCDGQIGGADITQVKTHNGNAVSCP